MKTSYLLTTALLLSGIIAHAQQPVIADYLGQFDGEFAPVMINHQKQSLHNSGAVLVDKTENIGYYRTVIGVKHNAYGAINNAGKVIAPFKFDEVSIQDEQDERYPQNNYCFLITRLDGKYGAIDTLGNAICPPVYDEVATLTTHLVKIKKDGLWGWVDMKTGKILQSPKYEEADKSYTLDNAVKITQAGKVGLAAEDGSIIVPPSYESFDYLGYEGSTFFGYTVHDKMGIMDKNGKPVTPAIYDKCSRGPSPELFAVTTNDKTGIVDATGKLVFPLQYSSVEPIGHALKVCIGNKCGVINPAGREIIPTQFDEIKTINIEGRDLYGTPAIATLGEKEAAKPYYFVVTKGAHTSLFDQEGKQIMPFEYNKVGITVYHDSAYITFEEQGKVGLMNMQGKIILPARYEGMTMGYNDGFSYLDDAAGKDKAAYMAVLKGSQVGLFNLHTGAEVVPPKYNWVQWQNNNILYLKDGDSTAMATKTGKIIRGPKLYGFYTAVDTNRMVETQYPDNGTTLCLLTDLAGNKLYTNPRWEFKEDTYSRTLIPDDQKNGHAQFNDGLLKIWGDKRDNVFVDTNGKEVIFEGYSFVGDFWNGLAVAGKDLSPEHTVYGIINRQQEIILPVSMDDITRFEDNLLMVRKGTARGLIRKDGRIMLPVQYEGIDKLYSMPYYKVLQNKKYGITDLNGKMILPVEFDEISYREKAKLFEVTKAGKSGIADTTGHLIIPVRYDELKVNQGDENIFPILVKEGKWYFYLDKDGKPFPYRSLKKKSYDD